MFFFLKAVAHAEEWEKTKFDAVDGIDAFKSGECTLLGNQSTEDTGGKADAGFTALETVNFRWTKVADAGNTGAAHVLARWLNPACVEEDFDCDGQVAPTVLQMSESHVRMVAQMRSVSCPVFFILAKKD